MIRKFCLLSLMIISSLITNAQTLDQLIAKGLPKDAVPARCYFDRFIYDQSVVATPLDIELSGITSDDNSYYFFIQPHNPDEEGDFTRISVWMYDEMKDNVSKIFNQVGNDFDEFYAVGIDWLFDKKSKFNELKIDTGQKIYEQEVTYTPVVILKGEWWTGFNHSIRATILILPETGQVKLIDKEEFVAVSNTLTNMLMSAEQGMAQDYFITTTTKMEVEDVDLEKSNDYSMYRKQMLVPVLHVYKADGTHVRDIELLQDRVDMLR